MTKHRVPRTKRAHYGVKLLVLGEDRHVARWRDPLSKKAKQADLNRLGITNAIQRRAWAIAKAAELAEVRRQMSLGVVAAVRVSVADAVETFLAGDIAPRTRASRRATLVPFKDWLGGRGISTMDQITAVQAMAWRDHVLRADSAHATSTKRQWLLVTSALLHWARDRGMVPLLTKEAIGSACSRVRVDAKPVKFLQPEQVRELLAACIRADAAAVRRIDAGPLVLFLVLTGMRIGEATSLQWADVNLAHGVINLPGRKAKTREARAVTTTESPSAAQLLRAMHERAARYGEALPGDLVFKVGPGADAIRRRTEAEGAPRWSPHVLRRTTGSTLTCATSIYGGSSAYQSARRLGHSVVIAERLYVGTMRDLPRDARTIEAALAIEELAEAIISRVKSTSDAMKLPQH